MLQIQQNFLVTFITEEQKMVPGRQLLSQHPNLLTVEKIAQALKTGAIKLFVNNVEITRIRILPSSLCLNKIFQKKDKKPIPKKSPLSAAVDCFNRFTQSFFSPYAYLKFGDYLVS
jgi:hypothetical protein